MSDNILFMNSLESIAKWIGEERRRLGMTQAQLASEAGLSTPTIQLLEQGRATEIGFRRLSRILAVLGQELVLKPIHQRRPTLEELMQEDERDG